MIAIPNMDKPKSCQKCIDDCLNIPLDCYPDEYGENRKGEKIVCPLIEIIPCKECKHRPIKDDPDGADYGFNIVAPTDGDDLCPCLVEDGWYSWMPEDNFYCGRGERRTETLDERIKRGLEEWKKKSDVIYNQRV